MTSSSSSSSPSSTSSSPSPSSSASSPPSTSCTPPESSDHPWNETTKHIYDNKDKSLYFDPCQEAATKSLRCLRRNNGDRAFCADYFEAYRDCKKLWIEKRKEERRANGWNLW